MASVTLHTVDLDYAKEYQDQLKDAVAAAEDLETVDAISRWLFRTIRNPRLKVETVSEQSVQVSLKRRDEEPILLVTIHV